jgi:hypothetical protein
MSSTVVLDHVGVVADDVATAAAAFAGLGFCLTPLARHAGGRTGNRNVMLRQGYIELLSVVDGGRSATLDDFLARYAGIHVLGFGIADVAAARARLRRAGFGDIAPVETGRAIDDADPAGRHARFTLLTPPDTPEARVHLIRHHTREALWQDRFLQHRNHAVALEAMVVVTADPAASAARLSLRAGRPVVPDPAGGLRLLLDAGQVLIRAPGECATLLPDIAVPRLSPGLPWIAGLVLRTDDANAALRRWLQDRALPFQALPDAVLVQAAGVTLRFQA